MFEEEKFTDFELRCRDGDILKCHKFVLVSRSPVFHAMLSNDMKEAKQGFAEVPDFDSDVMKEVLRYMYCNNIEENEDSYESLIFAAEKYQLAKLTDICIDHMIRILSLVNVLDITVISNRICGGDKLFHECTDFIFR